MAGRWTLPNNAKNVRINNLTTITAMLVVLLISFLYTESLRLAALNRLKRVNAAMRVTRDQARKSLKSVARAKRRADAALLCAEKSAAESAESNRVKSEL